MDKIIDLLKIKGNIASIEKQIVSIKQYKKMDRFKKIIDYFKGLRNYLKYYGIHEEDLET